MTVELQVSPALYAELAQSAAAANVTVQEFLLLAAAEKLAAAEHHQWLMQGHHASPLDPCGNQKQLQEHKRKR